MSERERILNIESAQQRAKRIVDELHHNVGMSSSEAGRLQGAIQHELERYYALAAQQSGVREELSRWFNSLPCDSIGKEHFDRLCQIVGLAPDNE